MIGKIIIQIYEVLLNLPGFISNKAGNLDKEMIEQYLEELSYINQKVENLISDFPKNDKVQIYEAISDINGELEDYDYSVETVRTLVKRLIQEILHHRN